MIQLETDVVVVGAGPVGLFTVFALGQVGLKCVVVDALDDIGGQCGALYPEKPIYDIPGRLEVSGRELVSDLARQAAPYSPHYLLGRRAEKLSAAPRDGWTLGLSSGESIEARAVIVAAGAGAFGPNRPPLPGLAEYEGRTVFYALHSPEKLCGRRVVIAGGGDTAADWAVLLADVAKEVTLVHRRASFRAAPATLSAIDRLAGQGKLRIAAPMQLHQVEGDEGVLRAVIVSDERGTLQRVEADTLLCFFGLAKDLSALGAWGIAAERDGVPVETSSMQTCLPGVFAVGDIAHYPGKLKLILTGFAEAAIAAHAARTHIYPDQTFRFQYSTTTGAPRALTTERET